MAKKVKQGQEVSGLLLHAFARDSKALWGDEAKLFEGDLAHLAGMPERFGWDELLALYKRIEAGGASFERCGEAILEVPRMELAFRVIALAASPSTAFYLGTAFGLERLFSHLRSTQEQLPNGDFRATISIPPEYADSDAFFLVTAGAMRAVMGYLGVPDSRVELMRADHSGTFYLHLPGQRGLWARFKRVLRALRVGEGALREADQRERLLNERNRDLQAALEVKQRFLSVIGHELRTPLNGIAGAATVIRDAEDPEERKQFLDELEQSCARLLRVVSSIVDLSQLDDQHCTAIPEDCHIRTCVEQAVERASLAARAKGLEFRVEIAASVPEVISTDIHRVSSLLDHLCDNAIRFTPQGHCHVRVDAGIAEGPQHYLEITVQDTGVGIAAQDQARVFEMFTQVDESSQREYQGAGLGLALCRRIAAVLGGSLTLESEPGRGSTFRVRLPYAMPKAAAPQARSEGTDSHAVLVVDDSRTNRLLLTHLLRKLHWEIDEAENGAEAVAKAIGRRYRVIFMDCEMPIMDGFEATRELRRRGDSTPIVAVTAYVSDDARMRCQQVGMNQFIGKPIAPSQIKSAMLLWAGREDARA